MTDDENMTPADWQPAEKLAGELSAEAQQDLAEMAARIEQLPHGVKVSSNLDAYEKERPNQPFWFQHGGEYFHLKDPDDVDFHDIIVGQENPRLMLHVLLEEGHRDRFFSKPLPLGKMKKLILDYSTHFGLTDLGELAGSARSFNGTQGR